MKIKAKIRVTRKSSKRFMVTFTSLIILTTTLSIMSLVDKVNAKQIVITDNNVNYTYESSKKTVQNFLDEKDIVLGDYDTVNVPLDEPLEDGMIIKINRAVPVKLVINGNIQYVYTTAKTVGDFLDNQNIKMMPHDEINFDSLDALIYKNLEIILKLYDTEIVTIDEEISYGTRYVLSSSIPAGTTQVQTKGQNGVRHVTYEIRYINGLEIDRQQISEELIASPIDEVILQGTKETVTIDGKTYDVKQTLTMTATGYCNCKICTGKNPGDWGYGITASGLPTKVGVVAVDKSIIPLKTKLYIEGYGEAIAGDTGSAIKGYKVDLFFNTHDEAKKYGLHPNVKVYVLE